MTASVARLAASNPMPPQTTTAFPDSKKRKLFPPCSLSATRQSRTSGPTSRSSAATIATSGITLRSEPRHRPSQRAIDGHDFPTELAFRLRRGNEHFLLPHADRVDGHSRFASPNPSAKDFVNYAGGKGHRVRNFHLRRREPRDCGQLVQNLLQRQVLAAQHVTFPGSSLLQRQHMTARTLGSVHQVQARVHVRGKLLLQEIHNDAARW